MFTPNPGIVSAGIQKLQKFWVGFWKCYRTHGSIGVEFWKCTELTESVRVCSQMFTRTSGIIVVLLGVQKLQTIFVGFWKCWDSQKYGVRVYTARINTPAIPFTRVFVGTFPDSMGVKKQNQ